MAEPKTKLTAEDPKDFIERVADSAAKKEELQLILQFFEEATGFPAKMWGTAIIGFGLYSLPSGKKFNHWPLVGFSPRKKEYSFYIYTGLPQHEHLLEGLGEYKRGKACIYVKNFDKLDKKVLKKLIKATMQYQLENFPPKYDN